VAKDKPRDPHPLVQRVDALLRREDNASGESDVPVLTDVVDDDRARRAPRVDAAALEALARELERAVLERLGAEVDRVIEEKLTRTLSGVLGQSVEGMRKELNQSVTQMVREAVAASVASTLAPPEPRGKPE
jgi:DNA-binding response OmpR family regulator